MSADLRPARAGLVGKVYDFWCRPIRAEPLALFRILLGLCILGSLATGIGPRLATCCGPDALCPASAQDDWLRRGGRICLLRGPVGLPLLDGWLSAEQAQAWARWGERPASAYLLFALYVLALLCLTAGFCTRLSTLAAALLAATFYHRLSDLTNGGDALARNGLYFLLFAPAGAAWSVDSWLRLRKQARRAPGLPLPDPRGAVLIPPWSVRLMQIQLCLVYLGTGLAKLNDLHLVDGWRPAGDWVSGEAMYWVLNDVSLARWPYAVLPVPLFVCRLMSWATLVFEIGFTFLVPLGRLRRWVLLAGVGFHLGILAFLEVGWFSPITLSWYALFIPGERLARWSARLAGSFPRGAPGTAPEPNPSPQVAPAPAA